MSDAEAKRVFVGALYPGDKWKAKVRKMSDAQVFAIYMREQHNPHHPHNQKQSNHEESGDDGIPF
jgi:hypothetical protein